MKNKLVIITSIINPIKEPLSYTNVRTIYSSEERFEQVLKTINSVKEKIPNSLIVLLECSSNIEQYEDILRNKVDKYFNYINNTTVLKHVNSKFKSMGENYQMLNFLINENLKDYESIIKISGRYYLNNNFNYSIFDNDENIFRYYKSVDVVSTRLYKIDKQYFKHYIDTLKSADKYLKQGASIEEVLTKLLIMTRIDYIGVGGNIAVCGSFVDE